MKVAPLITVALILCIACPGLIQAKKIPKPKFCIGKNGVEYAVGDGYVDKEGEVCIWYICVKKKKKVFMKENKCGAIVDLETRVTELEAMVEMLKADLTTNTAALDTKCDATTCSNIHATTTDIGTCMSDLSSLDCPDSAPGKIGVVDGIVTNQAGINTNKAVINTNKADINTNKAGIKENKAAIAAHHGDWIVIQRRGQYGNAEDYFYKDFKNYEDGFGSVYGELWIGLKKLAALTKDGEWEWELQVDLTDWDDKKYHAKYGTFSVGPAPTYKLHVGGFKDGESTLGDSLAYHDGQAFSARDKDQDLASSSCALINKGGWWYRRCSASNLNGFNFAQQTDDSKSILWVYGKDRGDGNKSWRASVMKIKRVKV